MVRYVELHAHSWFSLLNGVVSPEDLIAAAALLGMPALALTDHDAVYGVMPFIKAARQHNIRPILGSEITLDTGHHLTLLVENETGWKNLCTLITQGRMNAKKGGARLPRQALQEHSSGLIALSGCGKGEIATALLAGDQQKALHLANEYRSWFGSHNFWIEVQNHLHEEDNDLIRASIKLAKSTDIGAVATNNVHYLSPDQQYTQDILTSIRHNVPLADASLLHRRNLEYYLKSPGQMRGLFPRYPDLLTNTVRIAERIDFTPSFGIQDLPIFPIPDGLTAGEYLRQLCLDGARKRYSELSENVLQRLQYELEVIAASGLENYFLIVWDIVRFAHQNGILCQGRGSAASSLVAYLLGISPVDPIKYGLVFERFLSPERKLHPDIDIDFDALLREKVIQYIYNRYGLEHAAMVCTYMTFRRKSSLRDIGRMFGLPKESQDYLASMSDLYDVEQIHAEGLSPKTVARIAGYSDEIRGKVRQLGQHNGGVILSGEPLSHRVPVEPTRMPSRTVIQWDKEALEDAGLIKIDILGLRMLSAISQALDLIEKYTGKRPDLDALTFDDPEIYKMISAGDTVGIFQVESRAQERLCKLMKPTCFADLIIAISLIRPGPIQGDMVYPYLRRRLCEEEVSYFHHLLEPILKETSGVILFQEDVLKIAEHMGGFTPGQGELLRRALGSKDAELEIEKFHQAFVSGAVAKGVPTETAELVFDKLRAFGGYSFAKSHAASFATIVYKSAWLKHYFPLYYITALLNNQPMGFWGAATIVHDARHHGIRCLSIDANLSDDNCLPEGQSIRIGFKYVTGFGSEYRKRNGSKESEETKGRRIVNARGSQPFKNLNDFMRRTQLPQTLTENLILAGSFDYLDKPHRQLIWEAGNPPFTENQLPLEIPEAAISFSSVSRHQKLQTEFRLTGVALHEHPIEAFRPYLNRLYIRNSQTIEKVHTKTIVDVAGLNVVHQSPPTAKGFHFLTLEDEFGFINIIVNPHVYTQYRRIIRFAPLLIVRGVVQREGEVINVLAQSFRTINDD